MKLLRHFLGEVKSGSAGREVELYPSLDLPLMNEDLEKQALPKSLTDFRAALKSAPIVVLASPEYNGSLSPALKNAIDWGSREGNLWAGKIVVLLSASPGSLGGARGLIQLRTIMSGIKAWVIHDQVQLPEAHKAFDAEGRLTNEHTKKQIAGVIAAMEDFHKRC